MSGHAELERMEEEGMKVYLVGGAVRDELMSVESKDRDYVVVGATHEEMIEKGFTKVGAAFPVYLHPETKEEYALARTERSTGPGYHDFEVVFSPDVTIEQDLMRRDLTINAIAKDISTGEIIDPCGGALDIELRRLRCVSIKAFIEDPLRVYRLARLHARYGGEFTIDPDTWGMCKDVDLSALPKERKFAEIKKCFSDQSEMNKPSVMIRMLTQLGEFPELVDLYDVVQPKEHHPEGDAFVHTLLCMDYAQATRASEAVKWAVLCHDLGKCIYWVTGKLHGHEEHGIKLTEQVCDRFGVPNNWKKLALAVTEHHTRLHRIKEMKPKKVYDLLVALRGEKDQAFLSEFIDACICDARGRGPEKMFDSYTQPLVLFSALAGIVQNSVAISKESKEISERFAGRPEEIKNRIRNVKVRYVTQYLDKLKESENG
ncbi:CCA tRNA nucleotidyltransferase [Escherichia phage A7_1]|nr:CCA tRNA nucleotidyltransferase [Escherichia phage A7_1]